MQLNFVYKNDIIVSGVISLHEKRKIRSRLLRGKYQRK